VGGVRSPNVLRVIGLCLADPSTYPQNTSSTPMSDPPPEYSAYFELFEQGKYYECHEVMERLWLRNKNRFYQALIQLAVALYHLSRGNSEGGRKLLTAAEQKFREHPPLHLGMDTRSVADWCRECRDSLPPDRLHGPPVAIPMRRLTPLGAFPRGEESPSAGHRTARLKRSSGGLTIQDKRIS
jgi:uncharacterized protein